MPTLTDDSRTATRIEIRTMHIGDDLTPFRTLNEEWITHFFQLEETDRNHENPFW